MNIQTQYHYEKNWTRTQTKDLLKIIEEEVGDADPQGTLQYIIDALQEKKVITVGSCKFRKEP
jgi:hypothetical protein